MPPARPADFLGEVPVPLDAERYFRVHRMQLRVPASSIARQAVETAARLWCATETSALTTDYTATGEVARYLYREAVIHQMVDHRRAFRRSNVDRYLAEHAQRRNERAVRQVRTILFRVGRMLHPREYPQPQQVPAPQAKRQEAATNDEIRTWYGMSSGLPHPLSERLLLAMDLALGAGARAADLRTVRGTDIRPVQQHGYQYAVVRLANNAGGYRQVPVVSDSMIPRLLRIADLRGEQLLLSPDAETGERNLANRINERLRDRGYPTVSLIGLRYAWILRIADQIPATQMLQLADLVDTRVLADNRHRRDDYSLTDLVTSLTQEHP